MAGRYKDCNPEGHPGIWLCHPINRDLPEPPVWMTAAEASTLSAMDGTRRHEYLASRWLMRQSLSLVSGMPAARCEPEPGRPVRSASPPGWHLSLSHCNDMTALATACVPVGIDIEPSQRNPDWAGIARRWFSPVEQEWLFRANDPFTFLKVWTLKEAWLKATGRGIAGNLQTLEVRKDFELYGDRPGQLWLASGFYVDGFLVTLVYRGDGIAAPGHWPGISLLEPPPDDYSLIDAGTLDATWEPLFHRVIRAKT